MNIKNANREMKALFHGNGYTGHDCIICVLDSAMADVQPIKDHIEHVDDYRVDAKNTADHASFIASQLIEWAPDAKILSYCVFPDNVGSTSAINKALSDVIARATADPNKQYFVNMSLGCNVGSDTMSGSLMRMRSLIRQCNAARIPVFVASGNDGDEELYVYPSHFEEPICVCAANSDGSWADFSTFHDETDFIEDAINIEGINRFGWPMLMSGTSMACPNVLGKAALLSCKIYQDTGVWPTEMQLYEEMKACAIDCETVGYDKKSGFGFVDIRKTDGLYKNAESIETPITFVDILNNIISIIRNFTQSKNWVQNTLVVDAEYTRLLKFGMAGADVKKAKDRLFELGYLSASTKLTFGSDTLRAVKKFQSDKGLTVDGIIGELTWAALFSDGSAPEITDDAKTLTAEDFPDNISQDHIEALIPILSSVSSERREFVLNALQYAVDPDNLPDYPLEFYIRGGNLFDKDLSLHIMTTSRLTSYFNRADYSEYYDGGREEMMWEASDNGDYLIPGADCSGNVVGWLRRFKFVDSGFDANANKLYGTYCSPTSDPKPGDFHWKSGHIGICAGAGLTIEVVGGAYGCQLTTNANRRVYSFVDHRMHKMSDWEAFGTPRWFKKYD